jgi:uncharacterized membrane protein
MAPKVRMEPQLLDAMTPNMAIHEAAQQSDDYHQSQTPSQIPNMSNATPFSIGGLPIWSWAVEKYGRALMKMDHNKCVTCSFVMSWNMATQSFTINIS